MYGDRALEGSVRQIHYREHVSNNIHRTSIARNVRYVDNQASSKLRGCVGAWVKISWRLHLSLLHVCMGVSATCMYGVSLPFLYFACTIHTPVGLRC